jgi:pimeloyl-ACP methyl ester carboxylesterase
LTRRGPHRLVVVVLVLSAALAAAAPAAAKTVWLCKPGLKDNPCTPSLRTTVLSPDEKERATIDVKRPGRPRYDCFYVYPTVSNQPGVQATKSIDPELRSIALYQAARYSRDCRVYAPVYRQITLNGLSNPAVTEADRKRVYADVREAWRTYLRRHNKGRGVVLLGHSQGTFVLRELVKREIDRAPKVRRRLISAVLLGGNVTVRKGRDRGGDFRNIKACRSPKQLRCVIAFSTFNGPVPADSRFGRTPGNRLEVLCTNPAALAGGSGTTELVFPTTPFAPGAIGSLIQVVAGGPLPAASTPWISVPGEMRARCSSAGGANVLQVTPIVRARTFTPVPDATWGLHLVDGNIALGTLTKIVARQAREYLRKTTR